MASSTLYFTETLRRSQASGNFCVLDVNPSVPVRTVPEFIAYAKANPHKLSMGSGGLGSPQHISGELFKMMSGIDLLQVHYRGGAPAIADLVGGQLQAMFDVMLEAIEHIRAGKLLPGTPRGRSSTSSTERSMRDLPINGSKHD